MGLKAASEHGATEHVGSSSFDASASLRGASSGVESRKDEDVLDFANGVSSKPAILGAKPARIWPLVFLTDAMLQHWNAWCLLMREGSQGIWNHQTNLRNNQGTLRNKVQKRPQRAGNRCVSRLPCHRSKACRTQRVLRLVRRLLRPLQRQPRDYPKQLTGKANFSTHGILPCRGHAVDAAAGNRNLWNTCRNQKGCRQERPQGSGGTDPWLVAMARCLREGKSIGCMRTGLVK